MAVADRLKLPDLAFWCFLLSVSLLPIGLGGNRPLPVGLAQAGFALSCFLMLLGSDGWRRLQFPPRLRWSLGLFAVAVIWAFLQTLPVLPGSWAHPVWQEAGAVLGQPLHGVIAISPENSIKGLSRLITYIASGVLAYCLAQNGSAARQLVKVFWITGAAVCAYGLFVYSVGMQKLLWIDKWAYHEDLTATFVNRNHFAVYAGMVMICGTALLVESWRNDVLERAEHERFRNLHAWLATKGVPYIVFLAIILLSILCSHSRAGLMLDVGGLGAYLFFDQVYHKAWRKAIVIAFGALAALALTFVLAHQFSVRFAHLFNDYSSLDRLKVFRWTLAAIRDNPWLGYGLNGFQPIFRLYQRDMIMEFSHAHSDVLESLLDFGVPGGLVLWAAIGLLVSALAHGVLSRRRNGMFPAIGLAASLVALGHATVDFDMQIPGVVIPWAALVGTGLAHSWTHAEKQSVQEREKPGVSASKGRRRAPARS